MDTNHATPQVTATSSPVVIGASARGVADAIDALSKRNSFSLTWDAARRRGTASEVSPQGTATITFILEPARGTTALTIQLVLESQLLAAMPDASIVEGQLAQAANSMAAQVSREIDGREVG